ncbi:putative late blight resistance protein homolog R1B-16 [Andrographis paniculata]|uniref:putative late blight resistance protein homolog R1B-16 n=1 Tax=Andrographis paniculata TaxID=175694 RepID=UPI0021E81A6D|nr:putative late blight resistance protein homolog R1B-16 [Andrographis paniculata]
MAYYAALASLVHLLEDIILHHHYPNFLLSKHPIMKSLLQKFSLLEASLQNYSSRGDEASDRLEARIRDVSYRAQDIIEIKITDQIDFRSHVMVRIFYPLISGRRTEKNFEEELREAEEEADSIFEELKKDFIVEERNLESEDSQLNQRCNNSRVSTLPFRRDHAIMGFDEYLTTIKDHLCGHSSQLQVITIVGMGGIGKTTLARAAFDDPLSVYNFDRRVWVVASQDFRLNLVLSSILKSMNVNMDESSVRDEGFLKERIYKHLIGRRYLVVIDDVWSTKVWDDVKHAFPNVCNGSRILLTSRLSDVAYYAGGSNFIHEMKFLDADASWNLLRMKVFGQEHCNMELEEIGKIIAIKCRGLPLAICVIAGILSGVRTLQHWREVARNVGSVLSESGDKHLSDILTLSYNNLSHLLKACFLYIASFPEDFEIDVRRLIRLWVAEGFLKLVKKFQTLEEVAEECVEDLVKRNLVIITKHRANGRFKQCKMHDVLRDFCRERAVHKGFFHGIDWEKCFKRHEDELRHSYAYSEPWEAHGARKYVRTILWSNRFYNNKNAYVWECLRLRLLKIFDVYDEDGYRLSSAPKAFSRMFHLKNITLQPLWREDFHLHRHIFQLQNLQILVIGSSYFHSPIIKSPSEFWQLRRLRHFIVSPAATLPPLQVAPPAATLEDLQTLQKIMNFRFTNNAIRMIPNLRKLKFIIRSRKTNGILEDYCLGNLVHLRRLEELKFEVFVDADLIRASLEDTFVFPRNLNKLSLLGCRFSWDKMSTIGSLLNLQVLKLSVFAFDGDEWEPIEGEFLQLKFLLMDHLDLKHWRADNTHFPRLQHLKIVKCSFLREIPIEIGEIPTLESITLEFTFLAADSAKLILEEQRSLGNDVLQVLSLIEDLKQRQKELEYCEVQPKVLREVLYILPFNRLPVSRADAIFQSQFQEGSSVVPIMDSVDHLVEQVPIDEGEDDEMHEDVDLEILDFLKKSGRNDNYLQVSSE